MREQQHSPAVNILISQGGMFISHNLQNCGSLGVLITELFAVTAGQLVASRRSRVVRRRADERESGEASPICSVSEANTRLFTVNDQLYVLNHPQILGQLTNKHLAARSGSGIHKVIHVQHAHVHVTCLHVCCCKHVHVVQMSPEREGGFATHARKHF